MKKTITILSILLFSVLTIQHSKAQTTPMVLTGQCNFGILTLSSTASLIGTNYIWGVYKNGVLINSETGYRTFNTKVDLKTQGSGSYTLRTLYRFSGTIIAEYSNAVTPTTINHTIQFTNIYNTNNVKCASTDSAIVLGFTNVWDNATVNVFATTGFGGAEGALLRTTTLTGPIGTTTIYNTAATGLMSANSYILVKITANGYCANGSRNLYFYKSSACRAGELETTSTNSIESSGLKLFPNPVEDILKIEGDLSDVSKIELYSSHGNLLESNSDMGKPELNFSTKEAGLYFVKTYKFDGSITFEKVTKR